MSAPEVAALVALGVAVGGFATLVGTGGGYIFVPLLLLLYPEKRAATITAMSLLIVAASASSGALAYARQRRIDFVAGGWFALATLPGAVLGALLVTAIPRQLFNTIFAVALFGVGAWLLLPRPVQAIRAPVTGRGIIRRRMRDRAGQTFAYSYRLTDGMGIGIGIGFLSSLLGIGGGIMYVPAMAVLLHFPAHIATATSQFVAASMALEATGVHLTTGVLTWDRSLAQAASIAVGAVSGAQLGARLAPHVRGEAIIRALAVALVLVAIRLALSAR